MLLDGLTNKEIELLEQTATLREYPKGATVIKEGSDSRSLFLIRRGRAEVSKTLDDDFARRLREFSANDFFGEIAFLGLNPRSATVVTLEPTTILELNPDYFKVLTEEHPRIGLVMYQNMAVELASRLKQNTEDLKEALTCLMNNMHV